MAERKDEIAFDDFIKIDLRVATIEQADLHPNADRLLKLQLDLGPLGKRQVCAGIKGYYEPQALVGRQIIVVANLAPRKIRGEESNGMLLAASAMGVATEGEGDDAVDKEVVTDVILLAPDKPAPAGSSVG